MMIFRFRKVPYSAADMNRNLRLIDKEINMDEERAKQTVDGGIAKSFAYHQPGTEGLTKITRLRQAFSSVDALLKDLCPSSRELSVALTNLETTAMWAIKAVVINDSSSVVAE